YCGFPAGSVRTRRFRLTYCTHRTYTLDESGQAMTPLKLQAEMGLGSLEMIDRRYFRHTRLWAVRPQLDFRSAEWEAQYGDRLGSNGRWALDVLSPKLTTVMQALAPEGLTAKEWETAAGLPVGTFYYCRDRLVERGRVRKDGSGRGARFLPAFQPPTSLREKSEWVRGYWPD